MSDEGVNHESVERAPLSLSQQQMWFMDRLRPGSSLYNIPMAFRLRGPLAVPALRDALKETVRRHHVLRTRFPEEAGVPSQVVAPDTVFRLTEVDLGALDEAEREAEGLRRVDDESQAPFDLANGPLFRATLLRLADDDHFLVLVFHHIVFDGASRAVLVKELKDLYSRGLAGRPCELPEPTTQFADHAVAERRQDRSEALAYWKRKFRTAPPRLQLPTDRNRPAVQTYDGALERFSVDNGVGSRLAELSHSEGATLFVTLLAAFDVLLCRYTGQHDIAVGVPVFGRSQAETDQMIGCFVNTLPVRVDLSGDPTFREALAQVTEETLDAFENMATQFDEIVRAVQPERDPSYAPLVQVAFGMLSDGMSDRLDLPGLVVEELESLRTTSKFDLSLDMLETADGLTGEVEYNVDLFDRTTIRRFIGHWLRLIEAIANDPDRRISELPLLTDQEWRQVVVDWNRTEAAVPGPGLLHERFAVQARRTPEATAVVCGAERISYAELDRRANQLAHALVDRGIGVEASVGVCTARSIETIVALLGILKSGAVYVPFDPEYPSERLRFMLQDSQVELLLTDSATMASLPGVEVPRLLLDEERKTIGAKPVTAPEVDVTPAHLACMFYTSGSSGRPKCAMLSHANYVNYYHHWEQAHLRHTPMKVHLQMTSFAFDVFIGDVTRALFSGATLVMVDRDVVMSPADLYALMRREKVNSAEFITPLLAALVDYLEETGQSLDFMDVISAGSDTWYARDFLRTKRLCKPSTRLIAMYGTSETSNDSSTYEPVDRPGELRGVVPVGRALANTRLYVLDRHLQPMPIGVAGHLHVGGLSLGRGYHHRPGLTAERFVPDPLSEEPGARLYRTGDLARWRADGLLEILGRVDNQVKIRGFRIELEEIESALRDHSFVDHAVVIATEASAGERRLIGYVTLHTEAAGAADPVAELRGHLEGALPGYMVPATLIRLDEMPLSANGKIDRRALPVPTAEMLAGTAPYVPPRTPAEEILAGIWCDLLGLSRIGVRDDFFALGGSSLLMTQVVSRIRAVWGVEMPVHTVYRFPTVAGLAARIASAAGPSRTPLARLNRRGQDFEPSFAQQQLWFHEQLEPNSATYNVPVVLCLRGDLDRAALDDSLRQVVARHETLRTVFTVVDGLLKQRVLPTAVCPLSWADLSGLPAAEREAEEQRHIREDELRPFDLSEGPLLRATLLRRAPGEHLLLLTTHHIATDGWSTAVLFDELAAFYTERVSGTPANLPELVISYVDFAAWQRAMLESDEARAHLEHWRKRLTGAPALTRLPLDRPRSQATSYAGGYVPVVLPLEATLRLKEWSRAAGVTFFMTLLASFQALLSRYGGEDDIVVGVPSAGRTHLETEGLVGFFVNMLPLRTDLSGDPTFRELVHRVRDTALDAYAHQDVPFEKIVEAVQPERGAAHNPLFQTVFVLDDTYTENLRLPGIAAEELPVAYSTSKFDVTLLLTESAAGLRGGLTFKSDLFDKVTIERFAHDWVALVEAVAADPETTMRSLPVAAPSPTVDPGRSEPAPSGPAPTGGQPRTPVEQVLAAVWGEVLHIDDVGVHDNFFLLGGYSLLATQVVLTLEEVLGHRIPVKAVFENPTVAALAERVEEVLTDADRERLRAALEELDQHITS